MIRGRLFGAGLPTAGVEVEVQLRGSGVRLQGDGSAPIEVPTAGLRVRGGGWRGDTLQLEWAAPGAADPADRTFSLLIRDEEAIRTMRRGAPPAMRPHLERARTRPRGVAVAIGVAVLAVIGILSAAIGLVGRGLDRLAGAVSERVPIAWEIQLGEWTKAQILATRTPVEEGPAVDFLEEVGTRLAEAAGTPYPFSWTLVDDPAVNALAAPGGVVVVFSGLIREAESPEEVAGVLAHEVQHVALRHTTRGLIRALGWRVAITLLFGGGDDPVALAGGALERLGGLEFSRRQETEADSAGVVLLHRAGIPATGKAAFFDRLGASGAEPPEFLSTHPASADRGRRVREWSEALGEGAPPMPLDVDWEAIRASLPRATP